MVSTGSNFHAADHVKFSLKRLVWISFRPGASEGPSERHEHRRNASPTLQCHSTYRNIGLPRLFMSLYGPPDAVYNYRRSVDANSKPLLGLNSVFGLPCRYHQHPRRPISRTPPLTTNAVRQRVNHGRVLGGKAFEEKKFCFSGYQFCDYHLGRHSASLLFGARDPKPSPYGKADMLWRLWRLILSRRRQHLLDHWI